MSTTSVFLSDVRPFQTSAPTRPRRGLALPQLREVLTSFVQQPAAHQPQQLVGPTGSTLWAGPRR